MTWTIARCRSCDAPICWAKVAGKDGGPLKAIPLDADEHGEPIRFHNGNLTPTGVIEHGGQIVVRYVSPQNAYRTHFATCPEAGKWRRKT